MKFSAIHMLGFLPAITYAAVDSQQLTNTLNIMADLSRDTADSAMEILASVDTVNRYFPEVNHGFSLITTSTQVQVQVISTAPKDSTPFEAPQQASVCGAVTEFVQVHQALLTVVINKKSVFQDALATAPIKKYAAELLTNLQACSVAVTNIVQLLLPHVPNCASQVTAEKKTCDDHIQALEQVLESFK